MKIQDILHILFAILRYKCQAQTFLRVTLFYYGMSDLLHLTKKVCDSVTMELFNSRILAKSFLAHSSINKSLEIRPLEALYSPSPIQNCAL